QFIVILINKRGVTLKPKIILQEYIEEYLKDTLENLDFKYARSSPKFSKEKNKFKITISFSISNYSHEDTCIFWSSWGISSKEYKKWYENEWGQKTDNSMIIGISDWNIPGWVEKDSHVTINSDFSSKKNFNEFIDNVLKVGIPYVNQINSWETAAELALEQPIIFYDQVFDLYLMADKHEKAKEILEEGIEKLSYYDAFMLLPELEKRKKKYFNS
ncbi:hypothetical protein V7100_29295, partial [Priestia megaterium]|uniref:hypothetical protein n=1 Tax=Priestia megaterium TaxID=1404 RepID=UPI002FFE7504